MDELDESRHYRLSTQKNIMKNPSPKTETIALK